MKRILSIIFAIVVASLLGWVNFYVIDKTINFTHAGSAAYIPFHIAILLHLALLVILILTAVKLSPGKMAVVWGVLIVLYLLPMAKYQYDRWVGNKEFEAEMRVRKRIYEGTATIGDFSLLHKNNGEIMIVDALEKGYQDIAEEVIDSICNPLSDIYFYDKSQRLENVNRYGKELARRLAVRQVYYWLKHEDLSAGAEYLYEKESGIINIDEDEFYSTLRDLDMEYENKKNQNNKEQ
jgi:hypothetical protein